MVRVRIEPVTSDCVEKTVTEEIESHMNTYFDELLKTMQKDTVDEKTTLTLHSGNFSEIISKNFSQLEKI